MWLLLTKLFCLWRLPQRHTWDKYRHFQVWALGNITQFENQCFTLGHWSKKWSLFLFPQNSEQCIIYGRHYNHRTQPYFFISLISSHSFPFISFIHCFIFGWKTKSCLLSFHFFYMVFDNSKGNIFWSLHLL